MSTVIALFDSVGTATKAAEDLMRRGVRRDDVDMISHGVNIAPTTSYSRDRLIAETRLFSLAGIGEVFAEGPIAGELGRAARGEIGGGLVGVLVNLDLHESEAGPFAEGVRRGGTLLIVKCADDLVQSVLRRLHEQQAVDMRMRVAQWRNRGWKGFDANGTPYTSVEIANEHQTLSPRLQQQPGPTVPESGAGGGVWSGIAPHTHDEAQIREHAEAERLESIHEGSAGTEFRSREVTDTNRHHFQAHFVATYAGMGSQYEEYDMAYRFGAMIAQSEDLADRDWRSASDDIRLAWEQNHPQTWMHFRDAIRFGWGLLRSQNYPGPERRKKPREENARYVW